MSYATAQAATPTTNVATSSSQNVIVVLRNQHSDLAISKGRTSPRVDANRHDQTTVISSAKSRGARNVRGFDTVNGFTATVTPDQAAQIAADPSVAAVYPDLMLSRGARGERPSAGTDRSTPVNSGICPTDPSKPLLEPEALQVTNTAFLDPSKPQAQSIVTGAGVKVGWLADGIDINNPDFIRADGSHVFVDYQDFSGDGLNAVTGGAEAFGDASSIAAQGLHTYDLANFVNPAHALPAGCTITVRGMAPGASLVGLKVFGNAPTAPTSRFIQAIDYAVNVAGVDVLNESFGGNPFPDNGNDPISLADNAAVDAGVTVVASTGDAGTNGTIGSPATSPKVIGVAATTTFRSYQQEGYAGVGFSNGTWVDNNISSLSSGGITQQARVPDLAAPGDLGWALCTPNLDLYEECGNDAGDPSPVQNFGGTSMSSPLTAGAAALVIQAYKNTHGGVRPTPDLVKRFLTSTATDLGHPAYEQGSGLLNSLAAVQAAESWKDGNGSPVTAGNALIVDKTQLSIVGYPGTGPFDKLSVRNVSNKPQVVKASTRRIGTTSSIANGQVALDTAAAPTYVDSRGTVRSYVSKQFAVPSGADRLDVSMAGAFPAGFAARIILIDPNGSYEAFSIPQGVAQFGHVDVRFPIAGTWTAYFAISRSSHFSGPILYSVTTSSFATEGWVFPPIQILPPGGTGVVFVRPNLPKQPSDLSASVQLTALGGGPTISVPMTLRAVVPPRNTTFSGTITGGNGRGGGPAQSNIYYVDVPGGKKDLAVGVTFPDPNEIVFGILTAPDGQVSSYQSNANVDASGNLVAGGGLQLYRRDPTPGRWVFTLDVTNPVSGFELSQPFTATVAYNTVKVEASLPNNARTHLAAGTPVNVPVTITNTSPIPLTYFADGRLNTVGDIPLAELSGNSTDIPLPVPAGVTPFWLVPSETNRLTVSAVADQPVNLDIFYSSGEPELYAAAQGNGATVRVNAAQVSPGLWAADIGQSGPFSGPAAAGSVSVSAVSRGQLFDPAVTSTTGDLWLQGVASSAAASASSAAQLAKIKAHALWALKKPTTSTATAASTADVPPAATGPVTLAPGESTTVTVTITPTGSAGTIVRGHLYLDTFNFFTDAGDELIDLPYAYTIG